MTIKVKTTQFLQTAILVFAFFTFFIPQPYAVPAVVYKLWKYLRFFVSAGAFGFYIIRYFNRISLRIISVSVFYVWLFVIEPIFTEHGQFFKMNMIVCIGFVFLLEYSFSRLRDEIVVRAFILAGLIASIMHFLTFILYANVEGGMRSDKIMRIAGRAVAVTNQNWYFLTYDNYSIVYFLPIASLLLYYLYNYMRRGYVVYWCYVGFVLFMYIYKTAATAMIAMLLFTSLTLYYTVVFSGKSIKTPKLKISHFIVILFGIILTVIAISVIGGGLATSIGAYFGKDGSFSGRDKIWEKSVKYIVSSPLIGYGRESEYVVWTKLGQTHCHNIILELLYDGGIIGTILFGIIIYLFRPKQKNTFSTFVFSSALLCYFIVATFDWGIANPISMSVFYFPCYLVEKQRQMKIIKIPMLSTSLARK